MRNVEEILENTPFWEHLTTVEKNQVLNTYLSQKVDKGQMLMGDSLSCMGLVYIVSGKIRVSLLSLEGKQVTLFHVNTNEVCVMTASCVIPKLHFETYIAADEDTHMMVIPSNVLEDIAEENIYVKAYIYETLAARFSTVVSTMEEMLFLRFDTRLAQFLLNMSEKNRSNIIDMTQDQIASELNTAREVVTRTLKKFTEAGYVELRRGKVIIREVHKLENV